MLQTVIDIALRAGEKIMELRRAPAEWKADGSPVTEADRAADEMIRQELSRQFPAIPVISEESSAPEYSARRNWERFWLVDPLDGTREFVKGGGDFTVNIALVEKGESVLGVLHAPVFSELYYAQKGIGAFRSKGSESAHRIFSKRADAKADLTVITSRSHCTPELEEYLKQFRIKERVYLGSSLKFARVAEGSADIYPRFGNTMEWDVAAGDCIYRNSSPDAPWESQFVYNKPDLRNSDFVIGF